MPANNVIELILKARAETKELEQLKPALAQIKAALQETAASGGAEFQAAQEKVKDLEAYLKRLEAQAKNTGQNLKSAFSIDASITGLARFVTDFRTLLAGAGVGLALNKSLSEAANYQTALVDMGKVTSLSLAGIDKEIKALPADLGSATALMQGYYQVMSAGVTDPVKAMDLLVIASKGANAAHVEQAEVIKALTKLMTGFSGEIRSAVEASDLLFSIEQYGQTTYKELVPVIGEVASISKQAHVRSNELGAALAYITQTAGSTSEAATEYKAILMGLLKPQEEMTRALTALGFQSGEALVQQRGLAGAIQAVADYAKSAGLPLAKLFESHEALLALGPLLQTNFQQYNEYLDGMASKAGKTETAFNQWRGTFNAVKQEFSNTVGKALIELGDKLMPTIQTELKNFGTWIINNKGEITVFFKTLGDLARDFRDVLADAVGHWGPQIRGMVDFLAGVRGGDAAKVEAASLGTAAQARQKKAEAQVEYENWKRDRIQGSGVPENMPDINLPGSTYTRAAVAAVNQWVMPKDLFESPEKYLSAGSYWKTLAEEAVARKKLILDLDNEVKELERREKASAAAQSAKPTAQPTTPLGNRDATAGQGLPAAIGMQLPDEVLKYYSFIMEAAAKYKVDPRLIAALIMVESGGRPGVPSTKGALGLMQLMPETAKGLGVTDRTDPRQSIMGGTAYLAQLIERYAGDVRKALAGYNWGPANVDRDQTLATAPDETRRHLQQTIQTAAKMGWWDNSLPIDWNKSLDQAQRMFQARIKAAADRARDTADLEMAKLKGLYEKGMESLSEYFDQRRKLIEQRYREEIQAAKQAQAAESDPAKKFELGERITGLESRRDRELESLETERTRETEGVRKRGGQAEQVLSEDRLRVQKLEPGDQLELGFQQELAALDNYYTARLEKLRELKATEGQISQEHRLWDSEQEKLKADQDRRYLENRLGIAAEVAGGMQSVFMSLYDLAGRKQKELLIAAKIAGVAEAIINTQVAITKALAEMGPIAGPVMAAVIAAKGAVSIATIMAQGYAGGGLVAGWSPTRTADNIPARLTAGEFVHSVDTVRFYGPDVMQALNRRLVPPAILAGFRIPPLPQMSPSRAYAAGGLVQDMAPAQAPTQAQPVTLINVLDRSELLGVMGSTEGSTVMWNWLSSNAPRIRKILLD